MKRSLFPIAVGALALATMGAVAGYPAAGALPVAAAASAASVVPAGVGLSTPRREVSSPVTLASSSPVVDATPARVAAALEALATRAGRTSAPDALRRAFEAYYAFRARHPEEVRKPYLYFVDYGLDSHTPRGWVFDMDALRLVDGPFTVAHGRGSSAGRNGIPTRFSNVSGSGTSSLGLFLAREAYAFSGHAGGTLYHSIGMRLDGLSGRFNDDARSRGVVVHGAPYVTDHDAGRSEGCPAMSQDRARRLIPMLANGALVFLYSPRDTAWLDHGPWVSLGG